MEIILRSFNKRIKIKIDQELSWYDSDSKTMYKGRGGELQFSYHPEHRKMYPKIIDSYTWATENNYPTIEKWVTDKELEIVTKSPGYSITVEAPDELVDDLTEDLYRHKISFEVNKS